MDIPMKYEDVVAKLDAALAERDWFRDQLSMLERHTGVYIPRGQELHKSDFPLLFEAIQKSESSTGEFNLPDLRGQRIRPRALSTEDALQQRLTVAEQRAREMEGMLAQVVSRCDYSLSCGKDALSKNCTAEIENIKLIASGYSGWDCFALLDGKSALKPTGKTIRADAIHLNQAGFELLSGVAEKVVELKQSEEFLKWRVSRPDMEYLKELEDYAEGKWVSEQLSHYKQFGEFEDMYDGWRFEAWVACGQTIED